MSGTTLEYVSSLIWNGVQFAFMLGCIWYFWITAKHVYLNKEPPITEVPQQASVKETIGVAKSVLADLGAAAKELKGVFASPQ